MYGNTCSTPFASALQLALFYDRWSVTGTRCDRSSHATRAVRKDTFAAPRRRKIDVIGFRSCSVIHYICWRISIPPELRNLVCCGNYTLTLQCSNLCITALTPPHPTPPPPPSPSLLPHPLKKKKKKKGEVIHLKKRKKELICDLSVLLRRMAIQERNVALHDVTWSLCMVYTELAPRRLQFHVAPAMPAL